MADRKHLLKQVHAANSKPPKIEIRTFALSPSKWYPAEDPPKGLSLLKIIDLVLFMIRIPILHPWKRL